MRPRERYARYGPQRFGDADLLALALGTGSGTHSPAQIAQGLLAEFGDLAAIADASIPELQAVPGVGAARAIQLQAGIQLGRRARLPTDDAPLVRSAEEAYHQLRGDMEDRDVEILAALYVSRQRRLMAVRHLTQGSDTHTIVDPRQIFRPAVRAGAAGVIIAHNHPSGELTPSLQDIAITRRLADAGAILGVDLLDHLVIGRGGFTSLCEAGYFARRSTEDPLLRL